MSLDQDAVGSVVPATILPAIDMLPTWPECDSQLGICVWDAEQAECHRMCSMPSRRIWEGADATARSSAKAESQSIIEAAN